MGSSDDRGFLAALFLLFLDEDATEKNAPHPSAPPSAEAQKPLDFPSLRFDGEAEPTRRPAPPGDA